MMLRFARRLLTETRPRILARFAWNFGWKGFWAFEHHKRRLRQGRFFPPFLFISPTNRCNLRCKGCWVQQTDPPVDLDPTVLRGLIDAGRRQGSYFYGILGGEPLLYPGLFDILAEYPDCYFQLFTNGTLLTAEVAATLARLGNVTPLISVEGLAEVSDDRRGARDVYARSMAAIEHCRRNGLVIGVASSVCRSNLAELVTEAFLADMIRRGVHYVWYYVYRPAGANPAPELALSADEIVALRRFMVDQRPRQPLLIVDAYWDHAGRALCPAAAGISHHIGPRGDIEVCPPIQFAVETVGRGGDPAQLLDTSAFLAHFRAMAAAQTRGCMLLEDPAGLARFMEREGARATSGRAGDLAALSAMCPCPSHHLPGREIPEKSAFYRFAKKHWFFGFGAYG
jgi:MoaA/NifB/PqqE/SkfB family radical SAM enzyme